MTTLATYPRITPFLWFNNNAEEAVNQYLSIFKNSRLLEVLRHPSTGDEPGSILTMAFELDGQKFTALNGGPAFRFTEAISLLVRCDSQEEIDDYWAKLSAGGSESQCGWLKDKFGLSWQIVPSQLPDFITKPAAMQAMLTMKKLDIGVLQRAAQS